MQPSEIRARLLEDHECIRALLDQVETAAEKLDAERIADVLGRLRRVVEAHNAVEERYLSSLLGEIEDSGPIRREQMLIAHIEEHIDILDALDLADGRSARALVARLRQHIAGEESTFLSSAILR